MLNALQLKRTNLSAQENDGERNMRHSVGVPVRLSNIGESLAFFSLSHSAAHVRLMVFIEKTALLGLRGLLGASCKSGGPVSLVSTYCKV